VRHKQQVPYKVVELLAQMSMDGPVVGKLRVCRSFQDLFLGLEMLNRVFPYFLTLRDHR